MPKTKRFVSAWFLPECFEHGMNRLKENADIFDNISVCWSDYRERDEKKAKYLLDFCKSENISVYILIGSEKEKIAGLTEKIKTSPKQHVEHLLWLTKKSGATGIDIDYERFPLEMRDAYTDFMLLLSERARLEGIVVSICAGAYNKRSVRYLTKDGKPYSFIDDEKVGKAVDQYRVMCYDFFCPPSAFVGPTSTAPWVEDALEYTLTKVPRKNIIAGLPTYSVDWNMNDATKSEQVGDHDRLVELAKKSVCGMGYVYYYDVYYLRYVDNEGATHLVWMNNAETVSFLLDVVNELDIPGVSFWVLAGDDPEIWEQVRKKFR